MKNLKPLMDSGYEGIIQAIELAESMGIPTQDLPWTLDAVNKFVDEEGQRLFPDGGWGQHYDTLLEPTGWSKKEWRAELRKREEENDRMWAEKYGKMTERALRQYIRVILEVRAPDDDERSETHKLVHMFLSEYGTVQAIELAEMLPDVDPRMVELFSEIRSHVEEIIEWGKGNFPEEWKTDPEISRYGLEERPLLGPFMKLVRELKQIALLEIDGPGHDEEWRTTGIAATNLVGSFQEAIWAVNLLLQGKKTTEEMMAGTGKHGQSFVELAERFGIIL